MCSSPNHGMPDFEKETPESEGMRTSHIMTPLAYQYRVINETGRDTMEDQFLQNNHKKGVKSDSR